VNLADRDRWLFEAGNAPGGPGGAYLIGDANLDGLVDGEDFGIWNMFKGTTQASWCHGDFDANGMIDGNDFAEWDANKFQSSVASQTATLPEPTAGWFVLAFVVIWSRIRGRSIA
jgi:hypothetical protein